MALARALVRIRRGARLLLLDEPTAHLDDDARAAGRRGAARACAARSRSLLVTHDPLLAALADRTVDLPAPACPAPFAYRNAAGRAPAVSGAESPARRSRRRRCGGRWRRRCWPGRCRRAPGIALTAVSGWLIVRAAEMPPVLTLLVAIVGVRFFGLGRAVLRWVERMTAHDAALRLAAATRVRLWAALAAQGLAADRTPGSALARVVGDVGVVQDLTVRVRPPMLVAATVTVGTVAALALVDPVAAGAVGARAGGHGRARPARAPARRRRRGPGRERAAGGRPAGDDDGARGRCPTCGRTAWPTARPPTSTRWPTARRGPRAPAPAPRRWATAWSSLGTGLAAVLATAVGAAEGARRAGRSPCWRSRRSRWPSRSPAWSAALQRRGALADAQGRLDAVLTAPVPADPARPAAGAGAGAPSWRSTTSPPAGRAAPTCCAA